MAQAWAAAELARAELGDKRRQARLVQVVARVSEQPTASLPQALGDWAGTKAAYRLLDNDRITPAAVLAAGRAAVLARVAAEATVLVLQDTTSLDYSGHRATEGLGHLEHPQRQGLLVHSALAVSTQGVPLGLLAQRVWTREPVPQGLRAQRRQRAYADKESARWQQVEAASLAEVPPQVRVVTVADREGDIYAWFVAARPTQAHLLVRATRERKLAADGAGLWPTLERQPAAGTLTVEVAARPGQAARTATCSVRFAPVTLRPPRHRAPGAPAPAPLTLWALLVREEPAPAAVPALGWQLLTSLAVETFAAAVECVRWYTLRWRIERYHLVLKSGCRVEQLQLATAARLERALALYCLVAWRLLWLTYQARATPEVPCDTVLAAHEWQALYCFVHQSTSPPSAPPTLRDAVRWIARLGGFLGRRHDGEPGAITIWRGLMRLQDIADTWRLLHPPAPANPRCG